MNLSVEIEENVSLGYCLKKFSKKGLLNQENKYFCEACNTKQVATRQMMIKNRPRLMLTHLKRFKMNFQTMQNQKLGYRIPYPLLLNIEENMIYQPPARAQEEPKKKETDLRLIDLDLMRNESLQSEAHFGDRRLWNED